MATRKKDWKRPIMICACGAQIDMVAYRDADGWALFFDENCNDGHVFDELEVEIPWPFVEEEASSEDFRRIGFRIE